MVNFGFFLFLALLEPMSACVDDQCRELEFPGFYFFYGERLMNHVIRTIKALDQDSCELQCYMEHNCVSINFDFTGTHNCDLNNATHIEHKNDLVKTEDYVYHGTNNVCVKAPCQNNGTCQTGFTSKGYRCLCNQGFTGDNCESVFINSTILSNNQHYRYHLHLFLAPEVGCSSQWILCYRQSSHGDSDTTFHENCDGKNNTVTIVQEKEFVFGGYSDIPWESPTNGKYGSTPKAFIFSLHNNENLAPFKSMVNNKDRAIYKYIYHGPTFGTSDLLLDRNGETGDKAAKTDFGTDYFVPENVTKSATILAGVYKFHPDEVEVFYLK